MSQYCTQCGSVLLEGACFCVECGAPAQQKKTERASLWKTPTFGPTPNKSEYARPEDTASAAQPEQKTEPVFCPPVNIPVIPVAVSNTGDRLQAGEVRAEPSDAPSKPVRTAEKGPRVFEPIPRGEPPRFETGKTEQRETPDERSAFQPDCTSCTRPIILQFIVTDAGLRPIGIRIRTGSAHRSESICFTSDRCAGRRASARRKAARANAQPQQAPAPAEG